ncbi:hypothetical protein [Pleomorphomonas sp. PLEO]|uniref:hypothetical protein n=1 Tax=Pleomorphomonas sp. PLEO TaxID=3239306 RepID=UPI00351E5049
MMINNELAELGRQAIAQHTEAARIDDEGSADIGLFHLLVSLIEFCDAERIDFDEQVSAVRQHFVEFGH